jgi:ABC-type transport system involved in multi-copper enzyme maturation permease subunit
MGSRLDSCGITSKYVIFIFNVLVLIGGLLLLILGVVGLNSSAAYPAEVNHRGGATVIIVCGAIVMFLSCLGCWGSIKENKTALFAYSTLVGILFVVVFIVAISTLIFRGQIDNMVKEWMDRTVKDYKFDDANDANTQAWNTMQSSMHCCGINGSADWTTMGHAQPPMSCCQEGNSNCTTTDTAQIYTRGCLELLSGYMRTGAGTVGYVALGFSIVMLVAVVLSCLVACNLRR